MSINLPCVKCASEKLGRVLESHKIIFYTESTFHELLCKPKDRVATEGKNDIDYETVKQQSSLLW